MEYNNTNYSKYDDENIEMLYIVFFLFACMLIIPQTYKYIKKNCDDENDDVFEEEYDENDSEYEEEYDENDDVEIGPNQRELKPDYSSNDDDEDKYI